MTEPTVIITVKEYESLKDDSLMLSCLEDAGVDNWTWYDEAMNEYREAKND